MVNSQVAQKRSFYYFELQLTKGIVIESSFINAIHNWFRGGKMQTPSWISLTSMNLRVDQASVRTKEKIIPL